VNQSSPDTSHGTTTPDPPAKYVVPAVAALLLADPGQFKFLFFYVWKRRHTCRA
jgi:hypothetical protein